ncbi:MAG: bifunctional metallophosphatase/5'-nucleotidase [Woeseiaceae bacterium]
MRSLFLMLLVVSLQIGAEEKTVTLMQLSDVHGHIAPHASIMSDGTLDPDTAGLARTATVINRVRAENPDSLLLLVGDTTHGTAEMMFSLGEAIMPALNSLGVDVFLPGNWDFGWGPRVYRQRFTANTSIELSPNNRTTIAWMDGLPGRENQQCAQAGGRIPYSQCHVTSANFPSVANNLYNYNESARTRGELVHPPYVLKEVAGIPIAVIGITSDSVPHQASAFNVGFRFTMGFAELPGNIAAARSAGADIVVVLSELGLPKNVRLAQEIAGIDVMFSAHTHERTSDVIVIEHDSGGKTIVAEAGEDEYLGRLDLTIDDESGNIEAWEWDLMPANSAVPEDPAIKALVDQARESFIAGEEFRCHTFGTNAFPYGKGHTLCEPLDAVVGHTEATIERFHALENVANNASVDALLELAQFIDPELNDGNSMSITNGFRFDVTVLGSDDGFSGDITIADLYSFYPIGAAVALADFSGGRLIDHWEDVLGKVFDPNPYRQLGGWFLGFSRNIGFDLQLGVDESAGLNFGERIEHVSIGPASEVAGIDRSAMYTLASCYPHGNPTDEVCRTSGATNLRFLSGTRESDGPADMFGNRQIDMQVEAGFFEVTNPENRENIFDPSRTNAVLKVAPDNFVHPVDALRWYLHERAGGGQSISPELHGLGRVKVIGAGLHDERRGVPESEFGGREIVQPTQGAGASWQQRRDAGQL